MEERYYGRTPRQQHRAFLITQGLIRVRRRSTTSSEAPPEVKPEQPPPTAVPKRSIFNEKQMIKLRADLERRGILLPE